MTAEVLTLPLHRAMYPSPETRNPASAPRRHAFAFHHSRVWDISNVISFAGGTASVVVYAALIVNYKRFLAHIPDAGSQVCTPEAICT